MTTLLSCPYMVKRRKIFFFGTSGPISLNLNVAKGTLAYYILFTLWSWDNLDLFYGKVKFCNRLLYKKRQQSWKFLQHVAWKLVDIVNLMSKWRYIWGSLDFGRTWFRYQNQMTNGPVNAHLISGPCKSTKHTKPGKKNKVKKWPRPEMTLTFNTHSLPFTESVVYIKKFSWLQ